MFSEIRKKFLDFFETREHTIVPSSSLIPQDSSVLFTTAGMQQFKRYYTGELNAVSDFGSRRTASIQKCVRTSDIDDVGDETHLTFFEMFGNFSFDDYWKEDAIQWGYEFLTEQLHISPERIHVSVFAGDAHTPKDEESYDIWRTRMGIPEEKIIFGSRKDNFWGPTGSEGPCGPTTELYVDDVEVWNIVFNEYYAKTDSEGHTTFKKTDSRGVDTGMGYERLLAIVEGKKNVFETPALEPLFSYVQKEGGSISTREARILTDHIRTAIFLITDGVVPSNKDAGYILRRILRKIIGLRLKHDIHVDIFEGGYEIISKQYKDIYPDIHRKNNIMDIWKEEHEKFNTNIQRGLVEISKMLARGDAFSGKKAFMLYESYGLPFDLLKELVPEKIYTTIRKEEFDEAFKKHQDVSRARSEKKFGGHGLVFNTGELKAGTQEELGRVIRMHTATHLMHRALRKVLGDSVQQMGSDITPERFRFDFNFDRKLTEEELGAIKDDIQKNIDADLPVYYKEMPQKEAYTYGALHFFNEKYPDIVRVYFIGDQTNPVSVEFCNGPHVGHTGEIGTCTIIKQESLGKNTKRIRATVV